MDSQNTIPYKTKTGLEIGKFYVKPIDKFDDNHENILLQDALLGSPKKDRGYKSLNYYLLFCAVILGLELYFLLTR